LDSVVIRTALPAELDQLAAMYDELYRHQADHGMLLAMAPDAGGIWKQRMATQLNTPISQVLVAIVDGVLRGFLAVQVKRLPPHLRHRGDNPSPRTAYISDVYVVPTERSGGIGRALVERAFEWLQEIGVGSVELAVIAGNERGQAFWNKMGFAPELWQMRRLISTQPSDGPLVRDE
jgi:GNAT superfamily N-acetyltransferase